MVLHNNGSWSKTLYFKVIFIYRLYFGLISWCADPSDIAVIKIKGQATGILTAIYMGYGRTDMKHGRWELQKGKKKQK